MSYITLYFEILSTYFIFVIEKRMYRYMSALYQNQIYMYLHLLSSLWRDRKEESSLLTKGRRAQKRLLKEEALKVILERTDPHACLTLSF